MATLQTLDRGIRVLEIVSRSKDGKSIAAIAGQLAVDRAVAYRLVATLEARGLVGRNVDGQVTMSGGIMALASGLAPQVRSIAFPHLQALAAETQAAAYLSVAQSRECVVILVAEPEGGMFRISYRVGVRHPLDRGAAGIAILAGRPEQPDDSQTVKKARRDGFAITSGQLQVGAVGVAAPILSSPDAPFRFEGCVGVVAMSDLDTDTAVPASIRHARNIAERINQ